MSPCTNLLYTQEDLSSLFDAKHVFEMVNLDLSETYDVVNNRQLLTKLKVFSISSEDRPWVRSFLRNHSLRVVYEEFFLPQVLVCSGIHLNAHLSSL